MENLLCGAALSAGLVKTPFAGLILFLSQSISDLSKQSEKTKNMKTKSFKAFALFLMIPLLVTAAKGQSIYSNLVMSLNPVAYWPLQETTPAPRYDMETNYGSFGPVANAYYSAGGASGVLATNVGAITGDSDGSRVFTGGPFAVVPTTDNRVSLPAGKPFSVEAWARATGNNSYVCMINQSGHNGNGGINGANASSGWMLCQNYSAAWTDYNVTNGNHPPAFSFHVFNGIGDSGGADVQIPNTNNLTGGVNGYENSWVYLCGVFDGTNAWLWVFSTNWNNSVYGGTNAMNVQLPITTGQPTSAGVPGPTVAGAQYSPDTWDPILFGCNRGYGANPYHGWIDEVAIYTNALTYTQITNHFMQGTNGLGQYESTILGDQPVMYWHMDAPKWTPPSPSTYPTAANLGSLASSMTNLDYGTKGASSAVYQPGTVPGATGPAYAGFGNMTNACAFNGLVGAVDAGYNRAMDPVGISNNYTLVAWFRGNPMDTYIGSRWNTLASHSDNSWKAMFKTSTTYGSKGAGNQPTITPTTYNVNDGKWHMYTLESTYTNGSSTNVSIYLDNGANYATAANPSYAIGSAFYDIWLGGAPDYSEPSNELSYNSSQQYFAGEVAHVAYFTNALTLSQIQSLFYTADPAPTITKQPGSANAGLNGAFTNTVIVGGTAPFFFQWYSNNAAISGQTSSNLVLNPVLTSDNGNYFVIITNAYGAITSSVVSLTVISNVTLFGQFPVTQTNPISLFYGDTVGGTNYIGSSPKFSVIALGAPPLSYEWMTNGVAAGGATSSSYSIADAQLTSPTNIECIVANSFGSVTSQVWSVNYIPAPMAPFPQAVLAAQPIAYWRLNEADDGLFNGNPGAIANDYQSGNNGIYTNAYLSDANGGTGYNPNTDPNEYSAQFGSYANPSSFAGSIGTNIDFSAPQGVNAEFTVAIWANGNSTKQVGNGGIVTKGYFNGEEVNIDNGGPTNASSQNQSTLRLEVRDAAAGDHDADSGIFMGTDSRWHFIVGVCDEANGAIDLYFDGRLVASASMPVQGGIDNSATVPLIIGARTSAATGVAPGNEQFFGFLNDLAIYNYAFTPAQVLAQYDSAGIAPYFAQEPVVTTNIDQATTLTVPTTVIGSAPLSYQWYDEGAGNTPMAGQTNATLVISNDMTSDNYYLVVNNQYGSATSVTVQVTIYSGLPQITTQVQSPFYGIAGGSTSNSVFAYGTAPITYQWQVGNGTTWTNLSDNGRITGSQTPAITIGSIKASDVADYQVVVANSYGSVTSTVAPLVVSGVLPLSFYNGLGWTIGTGSKFSSGILTLTYGTTGNGTYFFDVPQYIGAFEASFRYQATYDSTFPLADGITFCLQNDPRGTAATGLGGGDLGFTGIQPSVAFQINIYPGNGLGGAGYGFGGNGTIGMTTAPGSVNLTNGVVDVSLHYANGNLACAFSNELSLATFSTNIVTGDITQVLDGDTAYVGFTGAFGGDTSVQTVQNFQFASIPPQAIAYAAGSAMIAWPGSISGYTLQQNSSLTTTNWVEVTNSVLLFTNGVNMAIVPAAGTNEYYRLALPLSQ